MTAMLAVSARHLGMLRPREPAYAQAAMALVSRSCALFSTELDRGDDLDNYDPLFFMAQLIHYLAWCNLEFLERPQAPRGGDGRRPLDLSGDQLFLLGSGVRVFLSGTRAQGSNSIFAKMWQDTRCRALDTAVAEQGMDSEGIVEAFMERFDELTPGSSPDHAPEGRGCPPDQGDAERTAFRGIVERLSVMMALWKHRDAGFPPLERTDIERYVLAFPLFCFGRFLDMIGANDSRALLVMHHFYRTSRLLLGEETWWSSERSKIMEDLTLRELESRGVAVSVRGVGS